MDHLRCVVEENPYRLADDIWGIGFKQLMSSEQKKNLEIAKVIPFAETNVKLKEYVFEEKDRTQGSLWQMLMALRECGLKNDALLEPHFQNCHDDFPAPDIYKNIPAGYMPPDLGALKGTAWEQLSGYYGMVKRLGEALGRIRDALKSLGMDENTIVVFSSDHGCHFKTRNSEYKRSCHESSIRIPLAFYGGPFTGGGKIREKVSLIDVAPTLLDACGIDVPGDMQGVSIMPAIRHERNDAQRDIFVQISEAVVGRAIRTNRWKYSIEAPDQDPLSDPGSAQYTEAYLYDLDHDPYELHNLIHSSAHEQVCHVLAEKLKKLMKQAGEEIPEISFVEKYPMGARKVFPGEENM